jgi:hypothetical protein
VGAIVQTVRGDGGLTVSFANQLFGTSLPATPTNPGSPGTPTPTTSPNSPTNPTTATPTSPDGSVIANAQQGGERGSAVNNQCPAGSVKMASGQVKDNQTRSASPSGQTDCPSGSNDDTAILKILE